MKSYGNLCVASSVAPGVLLFCRTVCVVLASVREYGDLTTTQLALAVALSGLVALWAVAETVVLLEAVAEREPGTVSVSELEAVTIGAPADGEVSSWDVAKTAASDALAKADPRDAASVARRMLPSFRAGGELSLILFLMFMFDRTSLVPKGEKLANPLQFWALTVLIFLVALCTVRKSPGDVLLSREQTDEWKGWMQIMFVMYHYFAEKEVYNAIRVYIAAYVWMTGYGNFFLYRKGKSFTLRRNLQMLFRLNFFGFLTCAVLNNELMLYYICPMHTFFTVLVVLMLYIGQSYNTSTSAVYVKIVLTIVLVVLLYDVSDTLFRAVFGTIPGVRQIFAFHDPVHPEFTDEMHEWHFRSGLDRFIWIFGMMCALHFPDVVGLVQKFDECPFNTRCLISVFVAGVCALLSGIWWWRCFTLDKYAYNRVHPYTSLIPITLYLLLRNCSGFLRERYLWLYAFIGRITLETYILQFHLWMKTTGPNGSPKSLAVVVPNYYLNFVILTALYLFVSLRVNRITLLLKDTLIPENPRTLFGIWCCALIYSVCCWGIACVMQGGREDTLSS